MLERVEHKIKQIADPNKMTFMKAMSIWRQKTGHKGIAPKKDSPEYHAVMKIMKDGK